MPRKETPLTPGDGAVVRFAEELRRLRAAAGTPSYRELGTRAGVSASALSAAAGGRKLPTLAVTRAYVRACAGDVADWERRWQEAAAQLAASGPDTLSGPAPYQGLAPYGEAEADRFFGREHLVGEVLRRLTGHHLVVLFGASGAGKSSLVRAGVLPRLARRALVLTPGARPRAACVALLAGPAGLTEAQVAGQLADDRGLDRVLRLIPGESVLVVDQFEEVFTHCPDPGERAGFIRALTEAASGHCQVLLVVRSGFHPHCAEHPELVRAWRDAQVTVGPLSHEELRQVVSGPANRAGLSVEPGLVTELVADAAGQPGALPLVSHALLATWRSRRGNALTLAGFQAAGGVHGALASTAEEVYAERTAEQRVLTRRLFLRLVALGEGAPDTTRRVPLAAFEPATRTVIEAFAQARLLLVDRVEVQIAHETLLRAWPRLRGWLSEDRAALSRARRLTAAAADWDRGHRATELLYRGNRLAEWEEADLADLTPLEQDFLAAGKALRDKEIALVTRRRRRVLTGLCAAVVVACVLALVAVVQAGLATGERELAQHRQLVAAARAELPRDPELGLLLAIRAYDQRPDAAATAVLRQAVTESAVRAGRPTGAGGLSGVAVSQDGTRVAALGRDGVIRLLRRDGDQLTAAPEPVRAEGGQSAVAFADFGAVVSGGSGLVTLWRAGEGVALPGASPGRVTALATGLNGRLVAAATEGEVRVWDLYDLGEPRRVSADAPVVGLAFSPDGEELRGGSAAGTVYWWPRTGETGFRHEKTRDVTGFAFSPDGRMSASASADGTVRVHPRVAGEPVTELRDHGGPVGALTFSPDSRLLATGGEDGTIRLWHTATRQETQVLRGHRGAVTGLSFSPDSARLASSGADGTVRLWDPAGPAATVLPGGHESPARDAESTPRGTVISGGQDGALRVWPTPDSPTPQVITPPGDPAAIVAVSATAHHLASADTRGRLRMWDLAAGRQLQEFPGDPTGRGIALSPDSALLAAPGKDNTILIWRTARPEVSFRLDGHTRPVRRLSFNPAGTHLASVADDGTTRLWNPHTGQLLRTLPGPAHAAAFSPDNTRLATAGEDGQLRLWSVPEDTPPVLLPSPGTPVRDLAFSPDGKRLATAGADRTARVFTLDSAEEPVVVRGFGATVESIGYIPDGRLVSAHGDGSTRVWRCEVCVPDAQLRVLAGHRVTRELTEEEKASFPE